MVISLLCPLPLDFLSPIEEHEAQSFQLPKNIANSLNQWNSKSIEILSLESPIDFYMNPYLLDPKN